METQRTDKFWRKKRHGMGGIRCNCCNAYGVSPRKSKARDARFVRRKMRQELKDALKQADE